MAGLYLRKGTTALFFILSLFLFSGPFARAGGYRLPCPDLDPTEESEAFQRYQLRPKTEFSKLVYMIDRFDGADFMINYDGRRYDTTFAANFARWFLRRFYKGQKAEKWILEWCNRTVPRDNLVWVEFPDGKLRLAREVLMDELAALEEAERLGAGDKK